MHWRQDDATDEADALWFEVLGAVFPTFLAISMTKIPPVVLSFSVSP